MTRPSIIPTLHACFWPVLAIYIAGYAIVYALFVVTP